MIQYKKRKALNIKYSGRSSDYITPSIGYGCLYKCSYCYMRRYNPEGVSIASNLDDIISYIDNHVNSLEWPKKPNQTHGKYWTYDISCNEDYILHLKYHNWQKLFDYFKYSDKAFGTAATKHVSKILLESDYNPNNKIRIRFSLMPQKLSNILEPNTSKIIDRLEAIDTFIDKGYDVHINWSPIIVNKDSLKLYEELFYLTNKIVSYKHKVHAEAIFLTHNEKLHNYNLFNNIEGEDLLWTPDIQEEKISSYGSKNIRYKWQLKEKMKNTFINLHNDIIPWNNIRYIF